MSDSNENRPDDEVEALYRRASQVDTSRPSESVRRAILHHAATLAAKSAPTAGAAERSRGRSAVRRGWQRPVAYGGLAAAALAGLVVVPRLAPPALPPSDPRPIPAEVHSSDTPPPRAPAASSGTPLREEVPAKAAQHASPMLASTPAPMVPPAPSPTSASAGAAARSVATSALGVAAASGDIPRLRALLGNQPDIDARDSTGRTALMLAVQNGRMDAVELLLAGGADANTADAGGATPLQVALSRDDQAIAAALRRAGAH